ACSLAVTTSCSWMSLPIIWTWGLERGWAGSLAHGAGEVAIYWMVHVALQESGSSTWSGFLRVPTCSRSRPFREPRPFSMSTRIFESTGHLLGVEHQAGQQHLNR